jgi:hypothetical protein
MTRMKSLFAAAVASAIVTVVPAANAQTFHFVGSGSSAQWTMAALAADQLAINQGNGTVCHWTGATGSSNTDALVTDNRDVRILPETGNVWIVWSQNAACSSTTATVTDIWLAVSVDSTVGVRTFSAQQPSGGGSGAVVSLNSAVVSGTAGQNKIQKALWPDNFGVANSDSNINGGVVSAIAAGINVNVGMTDIRPEDALFATKRALATLNTTTYAGLGYKGVTANIGAPIYTDQGTGTEATPVLFALAGKADPITHTDVPSYKTIPIGAAPIVFITNNNGTPAIYNLESGVTPGVKTSGPYYAEQFFGGTVACDTHAAAFGGPGDGLGTPLTVFLREPLSGTMNTTEFSLFRSFGNPDGSQETGVINPLNTPYNPLALNCPTHGKRERAIGTGEVVGSSSPAYGVLGTPNSIGYIFYGFANASKVTGSSFNYLTVDGVDPLGLPASLTPGQQLPNCGGSSAPTCPASLWSNTSPAGLSYPNLRNGTYKAWSIYRWLIADSNIGSDPYGFDAVAQSAQDYVDSDVADFVPFQTSTNSDGLEVYHSHFTQEAVTENNGCASVANTLDGGNTLGAAPHGSCSAVEAGGDEGGLIEGPFGVTVADTTGDVTTSSTDTLHKGYKVTWKSGAKFTAGSSWEGSTITINGNNYTVANIALTTTILYVTTNPGASTVGIPYSAPFAYTFPAATTPGVVGKKQ